MIQSFKDVQVTVAGLGLFGGGVAVARWLVAQGARVLVTDQAPATKLADSIKQLENLPITFRIGEHRMEDFTGVEVVVASPAIPLNSEYLNAARAAGVPITTEIKLFVERCLVPIVAVTGTKGKSTTTAMLGDILRRKFTTWVGGNIGKSLLADLPNIKASDVVVLELSSYMLEHLRELKWSPHVAVLTMLASDHTAWHGSVEAYYLAKKVIFDFQTAQDFAVVNEEDEAGLELAKDTSGRIVRFGAKGRDPFDLLIPGQHNQLNAQAAWTAAAIMGVTRDEAQTALKDFKGLPHRLQLVCERDGVRYYNDSIATIPEAAIAALDSFPPGTVLQIVGGYDKKLPFDEMSAALGKRAKAVLCIGDTGPAIAKQINELPPPARALVYDCQDLTSAMKRARELARNGDVVLLSTGCASYDQFPNFEHRGEAFMRFARSG